MNAKKTCSILFACAALAAFGASAQSAGQGIKQGAKDVGHGVATGARDVGHATRHVATKVGHGAKDVGLKIGHGARDGWNATKHAVKHAVGKED